MKLKKIFVVALLLLSVFLIYLTTMDKKVYYLALGDSIALGNRNTNYPTLISQYLKEKNLLEEYRYQFIEDDLRITDLIRNIQDNKKIKINGKEKTIKNALIKADLVTISIGNEELFYKMKTEKPSTLYNYIDEMMEDMEKLLKFIREYCKEDILILGYINLYSNTMNEYIKYANKKLETLSKKYDISYIDIQSIVSQSETFNELGLTNFGHSKVTEIILPVIDKKIIQDEK